MPHPAFALTFCAHTMGSTNTAVCAPAQLPRLHATLSSVLHRHAVAPSRRSYRDSSLLVDPYSMCASSLQVAHQQRIEVLQPACAAARRRRAYGLAARAVCRRPWPPREPKSDILEAWAVKIPARDHGNGHARRGSRPSATKSRATAGERARQAAPLSNPRRRAGAMRWGDLSLSCHFAIAC